jgi:Flp pilus assembly protein protease CpaA
MQLEVVSLWSRHGSQLRLNVSLENESYFAAVQIGVAMMTIPQNIVMALLFFPLAIMIPYMDVRYRRIPNKLVLQFFWQDSR